MTKDEWVATVIRVFKGKFPWKLAQGIADEIAQEKEADFRDGVIKALPWSGIPEED